MKKGEAYRLGAAQLTAAGKEGRFEAELLLRGALGRESRARFFTTQEEELPLSVQELFFAWVAQRCEGVPAQYLLGEQEFMGLPFKVNPSVLVPRPDTEIAVEAALEYLADQSAPLVADIATGSGAIAVSLAYHLKGSRVWATDISPAALQVAQQNALLNGVADRVTFCQGHWGEPLVRQGLLFDVLISNPPYISEAEYATLSPEVKQEPRLALVAADGGLAAYREIVPQAWQLLKPGGTMVLEIGHGQAQEVMYIALAAQFSQVSLRLDLAGRERVIIGKKMVSNP